MPSLPPEFVERHPLEALKRSIDLVEYARSIGYRDKPSDSVPSITVLEHPRCEQDRIAISRFDGVDIYARIPDFVLGARPERGEEARMRLHDAMIRSKDTGTIFDFVQTDQRRAGRQESDLERVRGHLTAWKQVHARQEAAELEPFKRHINLVEYARDAGYQPSARDSAPGVTVLEHAHTRDRIAIAQTKTGQWLYAAISDYKAPREERDLPERTRERLRDCIARSRDKGSVVEFVHYAERMAGGWDVSPNRVPEHLAAWMENRRLVQAKQALEHEGRAPADREPTARPAPAALAQRIGDWAPSPAVSDPTSSEVKDRRRWQDAQQAIDLKLARATELARPAQGPTLPGAGADGGNKPLSPREISPSPGHALAPTPLAQRRYDWAPPASPESAKALDRTPLRRDPGRDR